MGYVGLCNSGLSGRDGAFGYGCGSAVNQSVPKRIQIERANKNPRDVFMVRNGPNQMRTTPAAPSARLRGMDKCILYYIGNLNPQRCLSRLGSLAHD